MLEVVFMELTGLNVDPWIRIHTTKSTLSCRTLAD